MHSVLHYPNMHCRVIDLCAVILPPCTGGGDLISNNHDYQKFCSILVPITDRLVERNQQTTPKIQLWAINLMQSSSVSGHTRALDR